MLPPTGDIERIANSAFRIPDSRFLTFHKPYKNMADSKSTFHHLLPPLRLVKTIGRWKTVIESMQSLGMDNVRVAFPNLSLSILTILLDETPAKWQSKESCATHPSTETEWPPNLLTRFSS